MCGLAGFWDPQGRIAEPEVCLQAMGRTLAHRGPDGQGASYRQTVGLGLVHRRLSILDLTPEGAQPMVSAGGRYVIVCNGEIYNYRELRRQLQGRGVVFRGGSDTEVMLAAFEQFGIEAALARFQGMFAFALWDAQAQVLHLVRDRLGIKPLYYGHVQGTLVFASELAPLTQIPGFAGQIDRTALSLLLRYSQVPAPWSIYRGIGKLPAGSRLEIAAPADPAPPVSYWSVAGAVAAGLREPFTGTADEAVDALAVLLGDAVASHMVADVPLGAFLSGGIDSSAVVALMQRASSRPVRTFSLGFEVDRFDEAPYAAAVARHLGTDHTELYVSAEDCRQVVPLLPTMFSEPFADSSQIPSYLVSKLARSRVTVALSGDGGDELFGGYRRYGQAATLWRRSSVLGGGVVPALAPLLKVPPVFLCDAVQGLAGRFLGAERTAFLSGDRMHKLADVLSHRGLPALYRGMMSHWPDPALLVKGGEDPLLFGPGDAAAVAALEAVPRMMAWDLASYLPDDILVKVDRASMAVGLEARVPLLDHRVVEFAWRLSHDLKVRQGRDKWILREVLARHVPAALVDRPKKGFGVPLGHWLRGPLRAWAEDLLDERRLLREGFLEPRPIGKAWRQFIGGEREWQRWLWDVLMFQAWNEKR